MKFGTASISHQPLGHYSSPVSHSLFCQRQIRLWRTSPYRISRFTFLIMLFAAAFIAATPVSAASYAVNFSPDINGTLHDVTGTLGPVGANQANWNNVNVNEDVNAGGWSPLSQTFNITDSSGVNSTIMTVVGGNADFGFCDGWVSPADDTSDFLRLFSGSVALGDVESQITIPAPFPQYDVYVYGGTPAGYTSVNTVSKTLTGPTGTGFVEGQNYLKWSGLSGPLTIVFKDSIEGFSIVDTRPVYYFNGKGAPWAAAANWDVADDGTGGNPVSPPGVGNYAYFNISTLNSPQTVTLAAGVSVAGLVFGNTGTTAINTDGNANRAITLGSGGVIVRTGAGVVTFGTVNANQEITFALAAAQTWCNFASTTFTLNNKNAIDNGGYLLTFNSTGDINTSASIVSGAGGLTKAGIGTLTLAGANSYSGITKVSAGTLVAGNASALGGASSEVGLGVAGGNSDASILIGGAFTIARDIRLPTSNTTDAGTRVLTLGGNTADNSVFSGSVILGTGSQAGRGVTLTAASGGTATFSGVIQNPASMDATAYTVTKVGPGTVILSNANNSYTGSTTIKAGTLSLVGNAPNNAAGTLGIVNNGIVLLGDITGSSDAALLVNGGYTVGRPVTVQAGNTGTITLGSNTSGASSYTGAIVLSKDVTLTTGSGGTTSFTTGVISGAGNVTVSASGGTIILSGANTYTGTTTINAGVVSAQNTLALGAATGGGASVASGAALELSGVITIAATKPLLLAGTGISSGGALRNASGANSYLGTITIAAGGARINAASGTSLALRGVTTGAGADVTIGGDGNFTQGTTAFGGAGNLIKDGAGTLTLSLANTYTGSTTISGGTLTYGVSDALLTGPVTITGSATLAMAALNDTNIGTVTVGDASTSGNITGSGILACTGTFEMQSGSVSVILAGASIPLNKTTAGTVTLSGAGANTYTGLTTVSAGELDLNKTSANAIPGNLVIGDGTGTDTVKLQAANQIADTAAVTISSSGVLNLNGLAETIGSLADAGAGGGSVTLGNNAVLTFGDGNSTTFSGTIAGTGTTGGITKNGAGTVTLSNANSSYTGVTTIGGGALVVTALASGGSNSGIGAGAVAAGNLVINNATLRLSGATSPQSTDRLFTFNNATVDSSSTGNNTMSFTSGGTTVLGGNSITFTGSNTGDNTFAPLIAAATTVNKTGVGTWLFSNANTFTGNLNVQGGTLKATGNAGALGTGGVATSVVNLSANTTLHLFNNSDLAFTHGLVILGNNATVICDRASDGGTITFTLTDNFASTAVYFYMGDYTTTFKGGSHVTTPGAVAGITLSPANASGAIRCNGNPTFNVVNPDAFGTTTLLTLTRELHDDGTVRTVTKSGNGTMTLTAASANFANNNTVRITGGTLNANNATTFTSGGKVLIDVSSGATFGVGATQPIGMLSGSGNVSVNGAYTLTIGGVNNVAANFSGVISGASGALTRGLTGTSCTQTLSGVDPNTYGGATLISFGGLNIQKDGALGTTAAGTTVSSGGALQIQGGFNYTLLETLQLNGTGLSGDGALRNISGNNDYAGLISLGSTGVRINSDADTLTLSNTGMIGGSGYDLTVGGSGNVTIKGVIGTVGGKLTKDGIGTLTLNGASVHTYTGATTVNAGNLLLDLASVDNIINASSPLTLGGGTFTVKGRGTANSAQTVASLAAGAVGKIVVNPNTSDGGITTTLTITSATVPAGASVNIDYSQGGGTTRGETPGNNFVSWTMTDRPLTGFTVTDSGGTGPAIIKGNKVLRSEAVMAGLPQSGASNPNNYSISLLASLSTAGSLKLQQTGNQTAGAVYVDPTANDGDTVDLKAYTLSLDTLVISGSANTWNMIANSTYGLKAFTAGGTLQINNLNGGVVTIGAPILESGTASKLAINGTGTTVLSVGNTYTGATAINGGTLNARNATSLGTTAAGTTVTSGAALELQGVITIGAEALTLAGTGISNGGALKNASGANTYQGTITIAAGGARINAASGTSLALRGITTAAGADVTIGGDGSLTHSTTAITGAGNLIKDGAGTLTLSLANTYTGSTTINGGVINAQIATSLGTVAGGVTVASGAALQVQGAITIGAEALTLNGMGVSNDGALRNMSGANTYGGLITLGSAVRINAETGSTLTLDVASGNAIWGSQNLTFGGAGNITVNDPIATVTGSVTMDGTGVLTLTGASTFAGGLIVKSGTAVANVASGASSGAAGPSTVPITLGASDGAAASLLANSFTVSNPINLGTGAVGTLTIGANGTTMGPTFSGAIALNGNNLTASKTGSTGTLTLSGGISGIGDLTLNNAGTGASVITVSTLPVNNAGTITVQGAGTGATTISGGVGANVTSITENSAGTTLTISTAALTVNSSGTTLYNSNVSGAKLLIVSGGVNGTGNLILNNNSSIADGITLSTTAINNAGAISNTGTGGTGTGNTLISFAIGPNVTGVIQNSAGSQLILSGANTFTGGLTIKKGTVVANVSNATTVSGAAGPSTVPITLGASDGAAASLLANSFTVSNPINLGTTAAGTLTIGNNGVATAAVFSGAIGLNGNNLTVSTTGTTGTTTVNGGITGTGNLTLNNAGTGASVITVSTLPVNNAGTITVQGAGTGATTISGGVGANVTSITENSAGTTLTISTAALTVNSSGTTLYNSNVSGAKLLVVSGGVNGTGSLILNNNSSIANGITLSTTAINNVGTISNTGTGTGNTLISFAIGPNVTDVIQNGNSPLNLTAANTYVGNTTITAGTLKLTAVDVIPDGAGKGNVVMNPVISTTATLNLNGFGDTINGLSSSGAGSSVVDGGTSGTPLLQVGNNSVSSSFGGVIKNSGATLALTKIGTGTLTLTGANTFSGTVTISAGVLNIQNAQAMGSTSTTHTASVTSGAQLQIQLASAATTSLLTSLTLNGTGISSDGALLNVSGNNTFISPVILGATGVRINSASGTLTLSGLGGITGIGFALTVGGAGDTTMTTGLNTSAGGTLTKDGAGTLTLSAANDYTGATTVNQGAVVVNGAAGALTATTGVTLKTGGTLELNNSVDYSGTRVKDAAAVTFSGGTFRYRGTAGTACAESLGAATISTGSSTIEIVNGTGSASVALTFNGVTPGAGTVDFTSSNGTLGAVGNNPHVYFTGLSAGTVGWATVNGAPAYYDPTAGYGIRAATVDDYTEFDGTANQATINTKFTTANSQPNLTQTRSVNSIWMRDPNDNAYIDLNGNNNLTVDTGAIRLTGAKSFAIKRSSGNGAMQGGAYSFNVEDSSGILTVSVAISTGSGKTVTKSGNGTLVLNDSTQYGDNNTFTGGLTINAGTVKFGEHNGNLGSSYLSTYVPINIYGDGIFDVAGGEYWWSLDKHFGDVKVYSGSIINRYVWVGVGNGSGFQVSTLTLGGGTAGSTALVDSGVGTLTLTNIPIASATVTFDAANNPSKGTIAGNLDLHGPTRTFTVGNSVDPGAAVDLEVSAVIRGAAGFGISKAGLGTMLLSNNNTFDGTTGIAAGTLIINKSGALGPGTTSRLTTVNSGATLLLDGTGGNITLVSTFPLSIVGVGDTVYAGPVTGALVSQGGNNTVQGAITLVTAASQIASLTATKKLTLSGGISGAFPLTVDGPGDTELSGAITTGAGTIVKNGAGTLTVSGAGNNGYTGATTINQGVLNVQKNMALGTTANGTTVATGAALQLQGGLTIGNEALILNGTGVNNSDGALRSISGANTYQGLITLGSSARINAESGTTLTLSNAGIITGAGNGLTVGGAGNVLIAGIIGTGAGGVTKDGAGALTLTGASTFTGAVTVSGGVLNVQNATALGTIAGGVSVTSGAALQLQGGITIGNEALTLNGTGVDNSDGALRNMSGSNIYQGLITLGSSARINAESGTTLTLSNAGIITGAGNGLTVGGAGNVLIASSIGTGAGGVTKDGAGTLTLTGASTYTGATTVNGGTLKAGVTSVAGTSGAFGKNSAVTLANTALVVLDLNGFNTQIGSLAGGGNLGGDVSLGAGTLTVGDGTSTAYGGIISGTGGNLTKLGSGTLMISGASTYSGNTIISLGTLVLGTGGSIANTASINVWSGTTLDVSGVTFTLAGGQDLNGSGTVNGSVTVANSATATIHPGTAGTAGTLNFVNNLTFNANSKAVFDLSNSYSSGNDKVILNNATLTCGGSKIYINLLGIALDSSGDYVLFDVGSSGSISGAFDPTPGWSGATPSNSGSYHVIRSGKQIVLHYGSSAYKITVGGSTSASATAGVAKQLTVTMVDAAGNPFTGFAGTKNLTFSGLTTVPNGAATVTDNSSATVNLGSSTTIHFLNGVSDVGGILLAKNAEGPVTLDVTDGTYSSDTATGGAGLSLTVLAGEPTKVRVETEANGGGTVVAAQTVTSGSSVTGYAITRDTYDNFVANVAATAWTLPTKVGVVAGDLVAAVDSKSAVFTGHLVGTATVRATSGVLDTTDSGVLTVVAGALAADNDGGATVSAGVVTLHGKVLGGVPANAFFCWGTTDGGEDLTKWGAPVAPDGGNPSTVFSLHVSSIAGQLYFYRACVETSSGHYTLATETHAWMVKPIAAGAWYPISVPIMFAAEHGTEQNTLSTKLGTQIASGVAANNSDSIFIQGTAGFEQYQRLENGTWQFFGQTSTKSYINPGEGFWVKRSVGPSTKDMVFTGLSVPDGTTLTLKTGRWTMIGWPFNARSPADCNFGGTSGNSWDTADNIVNLDPDPAKQFAIYLRNGIWCKRGTATATTVQLEPGKAYYYRHNVGEDITWTLHR